MSEANQTTKKTNKLLKFFKESKAELKKVTWPGKDQLVRNTLVILVFIIITCIILSICDLGFTKLLEIFTNKI